MPIPLFVFICLFLSFVTSPAKAQLPTKLELSAKSAILINGETGETLYEKNAHQPLYPASITKLITAMYLLEKKGDALEVCVEASPEAVAAVHSHAKKTEGHKHPSHRLEFGGTHMGLKSGEILPLRVLLYGLMLASGNDAANVIAEHVSGTIPQFIDELNAFVRSKGCTHTQLHTPHGLPHTEHKTTAYDMALLAKEAIKHPVLREVVKSAHSIRPASNKQSEIVMHQHNALVRPGSKFYYPKAIGIKTGYTRAAGYTLIAAAEDENRKLVAVVLGCETLEQRYRDALLLFETAFQEKKDTRTLFAKDFDFFSTACKGGKQQLKAALEEDLCVSFYPSEEQKFQHTVVWDELRLPIRAGQKVGEMRIFSSHGTLLKRATLFAAHPVEPNWGYFFSTHYQKGVQYIASHLSLFLTLIGCGVLGVAFLLFHKKRRKIV